MSASLVAAGPGVPGPASGDLTVRGEHLPKEIEDGRGAGPDDLTGHFRRSFARYRVPRKVYPKEVLQKNAVGKVAKPVPRRRLGA